MKNIFGALFLISLFTVNAFAGTDVPQQLSCTVKTVTGSFIAQKIVAGQTFALDLSKPSLKTLEFQDGEKVVAVVIPKTSVLRQEQSDIATYKAALYESYDQNAPTLQEKYKDGVTGLDVALLDKSWGAYLTEGHATSIYNSDHDINVQIDGTVAMDCSVVK